MMTSPTRRSPVDHGDLVIEKRATDRGHGDAAGLGPRRVLLLERHARDRLEPRALAGAP
jgi:hypothetical protein